MNAAPSQRPHPLFSWLIPKELINMHESVISIGTKDRACTLALWRSIRNTKGLLRGKLSVSSALGWADACTHTSKKKKKRYAQSIHNAQTHTSHQSLQKACIFIHTQADKKHTKHRCTNLKAQTRHVCMKHHLFLNTHAQIKRRCLSSVSLSFFSILLFPPVFSPFQSWVGNEFENWPISFALTEMSLCGGEGGVHCGAVIYFSHSNRVINIFSPAELVTRLFGVCSRSHARP